MPYGFGLVLLLFQVGVAYHVIRTGRSPLWIIPIILVPVLGCVGYFVFAILPEMMGSGAARRFADDVVQVADPGRAYREKKLQVEQVGSAQAKRELAQECLKRGLFQDAADLYQSALEGPLGQNDTALLHGLARAKLLLGDGAGAQAEFEALKAADPAAFSADAELDYARALVLQEKFDEAVAQYEKVLPRYPGLEARCRFALLLKKLGQRERAQKIFKEITEAVRGAPSYYKRRQREWVSIARKNLVA
ncbi:MAG TPA: hypothetical protein VFI93_03900 [Rhizomicrobium sp.]|jgi:hypothetical protein|nr:hypothetical protein [Rhizomicrobium sp.]